VIELVKIAADAILTELHDDSKATYKYLSRSKSEYCWKKCSTERKAALLGNTATNDEAESTLGGTTYQVQRYGRINLSNAAAVNDLKMNVFCITIPTPRTTRSQLEYPTSTAKNCGMQLC